MFFCKEVRMDSYRALLPTKDWETVRLQVSDGPGTLQILQNVFAKNFVDILRHPRDFCIKVPLCDPSKGENVWRSRLGLHITVHSRIVIAGCERLNQTAMQLSAYFLASSDVVSLEQSEVGEYPECDPMLKISILYDPQLRNGSLHLNTATYHFFLEQGRRKGLWL